MIAAVASVTAGKIEEDTLSYIAEHIIHSLELFTVKDRDSKVPGPRPVKLSKPEGAAEAITDSDPNK